MEGLFLVLLMIWGIVSMIVHQHAIDNGKTGWWGAAVFFFGLFGMVGYAISLASD